MILLPDFRGVFPTISDQVFPYLPKLIDTLTKEQSRWVELEPKAISMLFCATFGRKHLERAFTFSNRRKFNCAANVHFLFTWVPSKNVSTLFELPTEKKNLKRNCFLEFSLKSFNLKFICFYFSLCIYLAIFIPFLPKFYRKELRSSQLFDGPKKVRW